jgi:hypothetical protein
VLFVHVWITVCTAQTSYCCVQNDFYFHNELTQPKTIIIDFKLGILTL